MATVNFSVPDAVKDAFDEAFSGQNKSAVIAKLMTRAVEEHARNVRRSELYRRLTADRSKRSAMPASKVARVRRAGRP